jgi:hypothetical protein
VAKKNFTDLGSLFKHLNSQLQDTVKNKNGSVANEAIEEGKTRVQTDVYDVYEGFYQRTGELKESWKIETTADGIMVYNDRTDGDKQVAYIVHEAEGYTQSFPYEYTRRPFIDNMAEELKRNGKLSQAFINDLRKRGFDVK